MDEPTFSALGRKVTQFEQFDTFPTPEHCVDVTMESDEVTALCPVTGQPDQYTITILYHPDQLCLESKTLKLYFQSFREKGLFCEALSSKVAQDIFEALQPLRVEVSIKQKPRGGVSIVAHSVIEKETR